MGAIILRGITTALLVTVLTLFAGIAWGVVGLGSLSISLLLDIGLLASCLVGGFRSAKESGEWLIGGIVGAGYVTVGTLLLAIFLPISGLGFIQILAEGIIIGLVAGAVGAGGAKGIEMSTWSRKRSQFTPSYAGYEPNDNVSSDFHWDKEEEPEQWKEATVTSWIESSEGNFKGNGRTKRDRDESPDVQWPWDKEEEEFKGWKEPPITKEIESREKSRDIQWPWSKDKKELIDSGPDYIEPVYKEPSYLEPLRVSTSVKKVSGAKPWWE